MNRKEILAMVDEGTITAQDAIKLMAALEEEVPTRLPDIKPVNNQQLGKMLKILVDSKEEGKNSKVRVNVPISFIKLAMQTGKGLDIEGVNLGDNIDIDLVMRAIDEGLVGEIVNVETDDTYVHIVIE